jgi:membrane-associated protease RseP (regulator of RpoE activity)
MKEQNGWKWATLALIALLLVFLAGCVGATLGVAVGFRLGRRMAHPGPEMPRMPEEPWMPEMPRRPEMPRGPEEPWMPEVPEPPRSGAEAPWLGVAFRTIDEGALVVVVVPDSPAEDAGLREGDVITEVDGRAVTPARPLDVHIRQYAPGDRVQFTVMRERETYQIRVRLIERPGDPMEQ